MVDRQGITIAGLLKKAELLQGVSDTSRLDVEVLLAHVLAKSRSYLYTWPERYPALPLQQHFDRLLRRRIAGEPIAHLVGNKEFWSLNIEVNCSTLIPRPETELLVATALALIASPVATVLDLGTGTGAIALALASERSRWQILAVDVVPEAVALAAKNSRSLGLTNVSVRQSHWYQNLDDKRFDLIVSNPPYVEPDDPHLNEGDIRFEPVSALVSGDCGMSDLKIMVAGASEYLAPGAWLVLEHGYAQGQKVRACLEQHAFNHVTTSVDLAGLERLSVGRWRP